MPSRHKPRRGTLQFWPRKRARRIYPRTSWWPYETQGKEVKPMGFAAWKVGMTHMHYVDTRKTQTQGKTISKSITIFDAPSLFVLAVRFYKNSVDASLVVSEKWCSSFPKELKKHVEKLKAKNNKETENYDYITLLVSTQPEKSGMHKSVPELLEIAVSGAKEKQKEYGESVLGKELNISDIFKPGEFIDVSAVTKGHGFTGTVKRFGVRIHSRKEKQMERHVGSIGSVVPRKVDWRVPMPGQYGFFTRTEFNKRVVMISYDPKKITPKGGFMHYGSVKNFIVVEGSVPGPAKRLVRLRKASRPMPAAPIEPLYISTESKQGV